MSEETKVDEKKPVDECEKKAAELGFDLTKQFLTLAFAGIAFVVGLSFNTPGSVSTLMLWLVIGAFGGSALLGLLFLMHGVSLVGVKKSYDIYASALRFLSIFQISLMLLGTIFLGSILKHHTLAPSSTGHTLAIKMDAHTITYPIDATKDTVVAIDGTKVAITTSH